MTDKVCRVCNKPNPVWSGFGYWWCEEHHAQAATFKKALPSIYWGESNIISLGGASLIVAESCDHGTPRDYEAWTGEQIQHGGKQWKVISVVILPFPFVLQGMPIGLTVFQVH